MKKTILILEDNDIDELEWLKAAASNPAFDFLKAPEEDIYSLETGKPFHFQSINEIENNGTLKAEG